jgi:signal transduction histidine kinase
MLCAEDLLKQELFQTLPHARLEWICERSTPIKLDRDEILVRQGDPPRGFFILIEGRIGLTRQSDGIDMPIGQQDAPGFFGEIPVLTNEPIEVSVIALSDCRFYELSSDDFIELLHDCRDFERKVFKIVGQHLRGLESFIRNREKMAALGTLAAGLAHELNNPAAALVRALKNVQPALMELQRMNLLYGQQQVEESHTQLWVEARDTGYENIRHQRISPLDIADREEELLDWLEAYGTKEAWKLAAPMALGGLEVETLEKLTDRWKDDPTELREMGLHWLALSFEVMETIVSGLRGAERISELVQSMKSYSYLDRGAQQTVDVHEGLENTIRLFSYKIKRAIEIRRNYDRSIPQISAYGSELNQVWTNLIDNAIDAMNENGVLEIVTINRRDRIEVQIIDSGMGIPLEIKSRIFEPFFTTKPVGKGSGLGLEMVRRIIENRHHGTIAVDSQPGRTQFTICLPKQ